MPDETPALPVTPDAGSPAPAAGTETPPADGADTVIVADAAQRDGHALLDLERFLPYRLSVLSNRVSQSIATAYQARFGLAITEWRVMAALGRYPDLSANEVAERTAMDKVAVSRAVAKLLERGLLKRDMHDNDRRRSVLALSVEGLTVYDEVVPLALGYERDLLSPLDDNERATLMRLLAKLGTRYGM